jgi:hypothetical protein
MTDLSLGLLIAGVVAVAGVVIYNRLQERSARRQAERAFAAAHSDVLMGDGRREPTLDAVHRAAERPRGTAPDSRVDYIIELELPSSAEASLAEAWQAITQRFSHRALLYRPGGERALAALQLVSRAGVVPEPELIEFRTAVESLAAAVGGHARAPGMREALQAARQLDGTCAEADIQVALHVVGVAAQHDFSGQPFQAAPREDGVTLTLDVARTPEPEHGYDAMARAGQALARTQGGRLVDDTGRELDERALASIRTQVEVVRRLLSGRGIEPGSPLALRLFS